MMKTYRYFPALLLSLLLLTACTGEVLEDPLSLDKGNDEINMEEAETPSAMEDEMIEDVVIDNGVMDEEDLIVDIPVLDEAGVVAESDPEVQEVVDKIKDAITDMNARLDETEKDRLGEDQGEELSPETPEEPEEPSSPKPALDTMEEPPAPDDTTE